MKYDIAGSDPKVVETTLTDGSKVYDVFTEKIKFVCIGKNEAENLKTVLYHGCIEIETI
jgi:hypothetical protein